MSSHYAELAALEQRHDRVRHDLPQHPGGKTHRTNRWRLECARQILQHLMETEILFSSRMRVAIADPGGAILPFDPDRYEASIPNDQVPDDLLLDALAALRSVNLSILRALPDDAWERSVQHPEAGSQTLDQIVQMFGNHVTDHLDDMKKAGLGVRAL